MRRLDAKLRNVVADGGGALDREPMQLMRTLRSHATRDVGSTAGVARADETAIAPRRAPGDALRLEQADAPASPRQLQCGAESGKTRADDAYIGLDHGGQRRTRRLRGRLARVVRIRQRQWL